MRTARNGSQRSFIGAATWAAAALLAPAAAQAFDIDFIDAYRNQAFTQSANGAVLASAGAYYASTVYTLGGTAYTAGTVTPPGAAPLALAVQSSTRYAYLSPTLASKAAMDAAVGSGSYAYSLSAAGPPVAASYSAGADAYALSLPYLAGSSFASLQGANAAAPISVQFSSFTVNPAAALSFIFFTVYDYTTSQFVYEAGFLPATTSGLTLPAGTLQAGHAYAYELNFDSRVYSPAVGANFDALLGYDLRTMGQFATAVPEPAPWALLGAGLAALGLRRRAVAQKFFG
jgi:PEP-CTERM motif